jgi:hypothetical protein
VYGREQRQLERRRGLGERGLGLGFLIFKMGIIICFIE